jgi:hypothetical protein
MKSTDRTYYVKVAYNGAEEVKVYTALCMAHAHTKALKEFQGQDENARIIFCIPARNGM